MTFSVYGNDFFSSQGIFDEGDYDICLASSCCEGSIYLPIGINDNNNVGTGASFDNMLNFNNQDFSLVIKQTDADGGEILIELDWDPSFPNILNGFTFEKPFDVTLDEGIGSSWIQSCTSFGTPGDDYEDCIFTDHPSNSPSNNPTDSNL